MKYVFALACLVITFLEAGAEATDPLPKLVKQLKRGKAGTRMAALLALGSVEKCVRTS